MTAGPDKDPEDAQELHGQERLGLDGPLELVPAPDSVALDSPRSPDVVNTMQSLVASTREVEGSPSTPRNLQDFLRSVQRSASALLPNPSRCHRNCAPLGFTPRWSLRIAKADCGLDSEAKLNRVLLLCLGLLPDDEEISPKRLTRYNGLFERPLAADVVQAFADFYGWKIPPNMMAGLVPSSSSVVLAV